MKKGKVYLIRNRENGQGYVGATCTSIKRRVVSHRAESKTGKKTLHAAIQTFGWDCFSVEVIGQYPDTHLYVWEQYWIRKKQTVAPKGYNTVAWVDMTDEIANRIPESARLRDLMSLPSGRVKVSFYRMLGMPFWEIERDYRVETTNDGGVVVREVVPTETMQKSIAMWEQQQRIDEEKFVARLRYGR